MNRRGFLSFLGLAPVAAPLIVASQARALELPTLLVEGEAILGPVPANAVTLTKTGAEIFRNFAVDGDSASGNHHLSKQEMREWMAAVERAIGLVSQHEAKACQRRFEASRGQEVNGLERPITPLIGHSR